MAMRYDQSGVALWYDTPDAPAPGDLVPAGVSGRAVGFTVTVGVQPMAASNTVVVRYRVNGGTERTVQAWLSRTDVRAKAQYFEARFPEFSVGDAVEYGVVCNCVGRQVPSPGQAESYPSSFKVVPASSPLPHSAVGVSAEPAGGTVTAPPTMKPAAPTTMVGNDASQPRGPGNVPFDATLAALIKKTSEQVSQVYGTARAVDGRPLKRTTIRAVDKKLRSERLLGEAESDDTGRYRISYLAADAAATALVVPQIVLVIRAIGSGGAVLAESPPLFEAPAAVEVDLMVGGGTRRELSEFDRFHAGIAAKLDGTPLGSLGAADIAFLAASSRVPERNVAALAATQKLADAASIPASVAYALVRRNLPTDLASLAVIGTSIVRSAIDSAIEANAIPPLSSAQTDAALASLRKAALLAALKPDPSGRGSLGTLLTTTQASAQQQVHLLELYAQHDGTPEEFWSTVAADPAFKSPALVEELQFTLQVGALTLNHPPLVAALQQLRRGKGIASFRDLARFTATDWKAMIVGEAGKPGTGVPPDVVGASDDERAMNYAQTLARIVEDSVPSAVIAARLPGSDAPDRDHLVAFLSKNPTFDFGSTLIDKYLWDNNDAFATEADRAATLTALKSYQRIFRLTPRFEEMNVLLRDGVHSALQITRIGASAFATKYARSLGGVERANLIYNRAAQTAAMATHLYSNFNAAYQKPSLAALPSPPSAKPADDSANLKTLFGSMDFCDCEDCRSVLSPAAYFVDLLHFLAQRPSKKSSTSAKDVLFLQRRADLGEIELSCDNTNTPIPYVDLVNEILEDAVSPRTFSVPTALAGDLDAAKVSPAVQIAFAGAGYALSSQAAVRVTTPASAWTLVDPGWRHLISSRGASLTVSPYPQTAASADEAAANPEHLNRAAYDSLAKAVFPWLLPLDLWSETVRAYFQPFAVTRPDLMVAFAPMGTSPAAAIAIASERLNMTTLERQIIAGTSARQVPEFWGFAAAPPAGWVDTISAIPEFLRRAGLPYADLLALLATGYVNSGAALSIVSTDAADPLTCNTDKLKIAGIDAPALDRIHRFVRLSQKLGWTYADLDSTLARIGPTIADAGGKFKDDFVLWFAAMAHLATATSRGMPDILALWYPLDTRTPASGLSQYDSIFQNDQVVKPVDPAFAVSGGELAIVTNDPANALLSKNVATILASLGITARDLGFLITLDVTDDKLNLANLSELYRVATLARAANVSIETFLTLELFSGMHPFDAAYPEATLAFVGLLTKVRTSGFAIDEIDYIVRDQVRAESALVPSDVAIATVLDELWSGLKKIVVPDLAPASPPSDPIGQATRVALGKLPLWSSDQADTAFAIIAGTSTLAQLDQIKFINDHFKDFVDPADAVATLIVPTPTPPQQIDPAPRFAYALLHLLRTVGLEARGNLIVQKLAAAFKVPPASMRAILTGALLSVKTPPDPMLSDFLALSAIVKPDPNAPLVPTQCGDQITAYQRLFKVSLVIGRLKMRPEQIGWYVNDAKSAGWLDFNALPTTTQPSAGGLFNALLRTLDLSTLAKSIPGGNATLGAIFAAARDAGTTLPQLLAQIAQVTGWSVTDLTYVVGGSALNLAFPADYQDERGLRRLYDAMAMTLRLGGAPAQAAAWAQPDLQEPDARAIVQTLRARYGQGWSAEAKPLRDVLREKQRAALVAYLVPRPDPTKNQAWSDAYGLFQHYLIDVEMTPCQLTSRIKQAISSTQLFAQRARLNLEPYIEVDDKTDFAWRNWAWMKNYRVWQANREIFLYPENWIEPSLRDDKTPLFLDLENELLKNDITADRAEDAYIKYLEGLNDISRLEIVAMYHDYQADSQGNTIVDKRHVFGRTGQAKPHKYFYRRRIDGRYWTAWEKVGVDIEGDHLVPVVSNGRLTIYWPIFTQTAKDQRVTMPPPNQDLSAQLVYWDIKMASSEYRHKAWSAKKISTQSLQYPTPAFAVPTDILQSQYDQSLFTFRASTIGDYAFIMCMLQTDPPQPPPR
jgi:hypothetical protein